MTLKVSYFKQFVTTYLRQKNNEKKLVYILVSKLQVTDEQNVTKS